MDFNLSAAFNSFDVDRVYEVDDADAKLENATAVLANPEQLQGDVFDDVTELAHGLLTLTRTQRKQVVYLVSSGLSQIVPQVAAACRDGSDDIKPLLERYGYLMFVTLKWLGKDDVPQPDGRRKKLSHADQALWKSNCHQVEDTLAASASLMAVEGLSSLFLTTPERDSFIELFTRPLTNLMESAERMKVPVIRSQMFRVMSNAVRFHGHQHITKHAVVQALTYYVHLPPHMAEFLHVAATEYDSAHLTEEVLFDLSQTQFNANDTNGPKSVSELLVRLSEHSPRLVLRQLAAVKQLLDNSNQVLRNSVVEACGNIAVDMLASDRDADDADPAVDGLLDLLQERVCDSNPFVRSKAFQALAKIVALPVKLPQRRLALVALAVRSLDDKSTFVRRHAIKLLAASMLNHQFSPSRLESAVWKARLEAAEKEFDELTGEVDAAQRAFLHQEGEMMDIDEEGENDENEEETEAEKENEEDENGEEGNVEEENAEDGENQGNQPEDGDEPVQNSNPVPNPLTLLPNYEDIMRAKLQVSYLTDACAFIDAIHAAITVLERLLFSKNKLETLEAMDFLVLADAYGISAAANGIRKMLHLVWSKATSEEGKSVPAHLIDCYRELFLQPPPEVASAEQAAYVAKNLIQLTEGASASDLASLEKLLGMIYEMELVSAQVVGVLWQIFASVQQPQHRRGAIIVLGMFASVDNQVVVRNLDTLLRGVTSDDLQIAKFSCVALQRLIPSDASVTSIQRPPREDDIISTLEKVLLEYHPAPEWFSVAEQAISAIFRLSRSPDDVCTRIIVRKTHQVFRETSPDKSQPSDLAQLLYIVGHVAIKLVVSLERQEAMFKQKKHDFEQAKASDEDAVQQELEMIGGTSEDDFTDAISHVKERELLYGDKSLLSRYGPLVVEVCSNNNQYDHPILQRAASLCLSKLMCVSSAFCEANLALLITIMEKSTDPLIRANCVLGLGDMAVCFNTVIDERTDFLYRRLTDEDITVQRTCLMTVTFLILAGQVKVKGQLSSMAKCLENSDPTIADMCKLFFTELATKDNAIYNGFIDIFSGLSADPTLQRDQFRRIVKFLVGFISKDKHQKQLAEKLAVRLQAADTKAQWDDIAFVLNTLPVKSDTVSQVLAEGFKVVQERQQQQLPLEAGAGMVEYGA
ncbi:condensin complex subunit 1 [Diutina catenulata]